jgi:hypothetical protein
VKTIRGAVMLLAAAVAIWRGLSLHSGRIAVLAYALAALALALAAWHFTRKPPSPRV